MNGKQVSKVVPTIEQELIVEAVKSKQHLNINAGAGTGKTSSLLLAAAATPNRRGLYTTFTKAMVEDAKAKLAKAAPHVEARTMHSLAFGAEGIPFKERIFDRKRQSNAETVAILTKMSPKTIKTMIEEVGGVNTFANFFKYTLKNFAKSADATPTKEHVPEAWKTIFSGTDQTVSDALTNVLVAIVHQAWDRDICAVDGKLKFEQDYYLKMWQLNGPFISADVIYFDEIQDSDLVMNSIILDQAKHGTQLVYVGDTYQRLFAWRGSIDAAEHIRNIGASDLYLTKSWRFGPKIADEANKWLKLLKSPYEITGNERVSSSVVGQGSIDSPSVILCRTNGGLMAEAVAVIDSGKKFSVPGGANKMVPLKMLAKGAQDLKLGYATECPELFGYKNWKEVEAMPSDDLVPFVRLVNRVGTQRIINACNKATLNERDADVLISTVHSAKGLEWNKVRISDDFWSPKKDFAPNKFELMVGYVGVTRAINEIDLGVLHGEGGRGGLTYADGLLEK